jgi:tetratricopeptide (TPR) repeat protein
VWQDSAGESANSHYEAGNKMYQAGNFSGAKKEYIRAKELDVLRFRAPAAINAIIAKLTKKYPGITLVDTKSAFEQHSPNAILGGETILEHVHPNLFGYGLLSESFYQGLKKSKLIPNNSSKGIPFETLRQQMPITIVDSLKGAFEVMILKEGWPFNVPMPPEAKREKTLEEQLAGALVVKQFSWREAMNRLQNHYVTNHDTAGVLKVTEALVLENPLDLTLYDRAGKLSLALNENEKAITYLTIAFRKESSFERARQLFVALLKMDRPEEALKYIEYAAANNPSGFSLNELHIFVKQLLITKEQFAKDSTNVHLSNQLATGYLKFANTAAAAKYLQKSLKLDPRNTEALTIREQLRGIAR